MQTTAIAPIKTAKSHLVQDMKSSIQLPEFQKAADCIAKFPPLIAITERVFRFPPFSEMANPEIVLSGRIVGLIKTNWYWVGKSLSAFFNDKPNPLHNTEVVEQITQELNEIFPELAPEQVKEKIEALKFMSNKYRIYANLLFEGETFIRHEAEKFKISIPDQRSGILISIAFEKCLFDIMCWLYDWESPSRTQIKEPIKDWLRYQEGKINGSVTEQQEYILQQSQRWDKEEAKLLDTLPEYEDICPTTFFCLCIFEKYKKNLPSHASLNTLLKSLSNNGFTQGYTKFGIFGGEYKEHSRARKGKGKSKTS